MSYPSDSLADDPTVAQVLPVSPQKRGWTFIAWIVILGVIALVIRSHVAGPPEGEAAATQGVGERIMEMQARYLVGAKSFLTNQDVYSQAKALNVGSVDHRLRFVALAGELAGPAEARTQLQQLNAKLQEAGITETPEEEALTTTLEHLYDDYAAGRWDAPSVKEPQRAELRRELGWFGRLALSPASGPDQEARAEVLAGAQRTVVGLVSFVIAAGLLALFGLLGLVILVIFLFSGKLQRGVHAGLAHSGIYAETFAVWMVLFVLLSQGATRLSIPAEARWLVSGLASLLSLLALLWPVLRGIPWAQVRWEIGLKLGRRPAVEPVLGLATYAMALPLVAVGFLVTWLILLAEGAFHGMGNTADSFTPVHLPSHPIVEYVIGGDWSVRLQVLLLASFIAPLVEETMFRGVLYRHLRDVSAGLGFIASFLFSALLVSFLFAVIHPQGFEAVPLLMALAFTFCLVREWRGTLLPAMIAHGISNGVVLSLLILLMSE